MSLRNLFSAALMVTGMLAGSIDCATRGNIATTSPPHALGGQERDTLQLVGEDPLNIRTDGRVARYGDPYLANAVDRLADVPRPWTVPKLAHLFETDSRAWLRKLQESRDRRDTDMWPRSDEEQHRRLGGANRRLNRGALRHLPSACSRRRPTTP